MPETALHDASGVRRQSYCGAETVAAYTDPRSEFNALLTKCGAYELTWRSKFRVAGRDRARWLNGMVSNNVRDLRPGHGIYAFLLNPQAHILGDMYVHNFGEYFVIDTDCGQSEKIYTLLKRYIIMDQVELTELTGHAGFGVCGPESASVMERAAITAGGLEPLQNRVCKWQDMELTVVRNDFEVESYELWAPQHSKLWDALLSAGAAPVGTDALEKVRIAFGRPLYGQDIRERDLPQETEQLRALSFTKGCYIGQEIVERIRSRGQVHRKFVGFRLRGPLPPPGTKTQWEGKDMGEITTGASLPTEAGDINVALGYIRRELAAPGKTFALGESEATIQDFPLLDLKHP